MSSGTFVTPFLPTPHFILDLETTSAEPGSAIVSIGLVQILKKNNNSIRPEYTVDPLRAAYYAVLGIPHQLELGLQLCPETTKFWDTVSPEARKEYDLAMTDCENPKSKLGDFCNFLITRSSHTDIGDNIAPCVWGNAPSFDCSILEHVLKKYDIPIPWSFRNERDFRTARALFNPPFNRTASELPHHALFDALAEAQTLININGLLPEPISLFW